MAYEIPNLSIGTLKAPSTAFAAKQYHFVDASSSEGFIKLSTTAGRTTLGILQNAPSITGEAAEVWITGSVSKVVVGSSVLSVGDFVWNKSGLAASSTGAPVGASIFGPVLTTASSSGIATLVLQTIRTLTS